MFIHRKGRVRVESIHTLSWDPRSREESLKKQLKEPDPKSSKHVECIEVPALSRVG